MEILFHPERQVPEMKKLKYKIMAAALTTALLAGESVPAAAAASDSDTVILRVCHREEYIDQGP